MSECLPEAISKGKFKNLNMFKILQWKNSIYTQTYTHTYSYISNGDKEIFLIKIELKLLRSGPGILEKTFSVRWQKNRLHHESKVCCLSFLSADGFLLGGFEKKNLLTSILFRTQVLCWRIKDQYMVLFSQRTIV